MPKPMETIKTASMSVAIVVADNSALCFAFSVMRLLSQLAAMGWNRRYVNRLGRRPRPPIGNFYVAVSGHGPSFSSCFTKRTMPLTDISLIMSMPIGMTFIGFAIKAICPLL